jgi:hypothetical protein
MLASISSKRSKKNPNNRYIYTAKWVSGEDKKIERKFNFALVEDDNLEEASFNKLDGLQGRMRIVTKSLIDFQPEDLIYWLGCGGGQKYIILNIDGNRKEQGENAMLHFKNNGNIPIYITLKRAG